VWGFAASLVPGWARLLAVGAILAGALGAVYLKGRASVQALWDQERRETAILQGQAELQAKQAAFRHLERMATEAPKVQQRRKALTDALDQHRTWGDLPVPDSVRLSIDAAIQAGSAP